MITRALRFEISFPGLRDADRLALYKRVWSASEDSTRAANRLVSALWQVRLGVLTRPLSDTPKHAGEPVPELTLAYQALSGKWQPYGTLLYQPVEGNRLSGGCLSALASAVQDRISEDFTAIRRGERALATFRSLPIYYRAAEVNVREDGHIILSTWAGRGSTRLVIAPRQLDAGQRAILARIRTGEYKAGAATLSWYKRDKVARGKWMFSLTWTGNVEAPRSTAPLIAGAHLGITNTVSIAYMATESDAVLRERDRVQFPEATVRSWNRIHQERRQRSASNRTDYGLRTGRGRGRKSRVVAALSDKVARMTTTTAQQTAAAVIAAAQRRGAIGIVWEDLTHWSVGTAHAEADDMTNRTAAAHRKWYFGWHQGMLRDALQIAAEGAGLWFSIVTAVDSSRTCSACATVWKDTGVYAPRGKPAGQYGRMTWHTWVCSCGARMHADRNAAVNVARRGLTSWREQLAAK